MEQSNEMLAKWLADAPQGGSAWLGQVRAEARDRARRLGLPGMRHRDFRHTDLAVLNSHPVSGADAGAKPEEIERQDLPGALRLVFVDGVHAPELSDLARLPEQVSVISLSQALEAPENRSLFGSDPALESDFFANLNCANFSDGVFIRISGKLAAPLQLLHLASGAAANYPRCLVALDKHSEATLIEEYAGSGSYFTCGVSECFVGENSQLAHVRLQNEAQSAFHLARGSVRLARGSRYLAQALNLGGRLSRYSLDVMLQGEGAECVIDGLTLIDGRRQADLYALVDHSHPRCRSVQLQKCIADGAAHAVYNGRVQVGIGAVETDSSQHSRNLLLSSKARIDTEPQLEILNDDVKCRHGATVGQLDPEAVFYLKSRGLDEPEARNLLTYAFAAEIVERIPVPELAARLGKIILERMHKESA